MPEFLDATRVTWISGLPKEKPVSPIVVASTEVIVSDLLAKHTVQVVDHMSKPTGISVVLLADVIFGDEK